MLKLIIEDDEGRKTVVPFVRDEITIGRQEGNTIRLTERNVSRRHARLMRNNGHVLIEDLGSYNGIRINGDRISGQVQVADGDLIQIGDYDLALQAEAQAMAAAQAADLSTQATRKLPEPGATLPALPTIEDPEEDVLSSKPPPLAKNQATAVIRLDALDAGRKRPVAELDASEAPRLVVLTTEFAGREFRCNRTELRIGRVDDNDIVIDHRSLSRTHCKVVREDSGEWRIIDMQSANGLMVNGEPYAQVTLRTGDVIELGHVKLKFAGPDDKVEVSAPTSSTTNPDLSGSPGKKPLIALAITVLVLLVGGGGYLVMKSTEATPVPDPTAAPANPAVNPEAQRTAQLKVAQSKLIQARAAAAQLDFNNAELMAKEARVGGELISDAREFMELLEAERGNRSALELAGRLLDQGQHEKAKDKLESAAGTQLLRERYDQLETRRGKAASEKVAVKSDPTPKVTEKTPVEKPVVEKPPVEKPVAEKPPVEKPEPDKKPKTAGGNPELDTLLSEAEAERKNGNYERSRMLVEQCIKQNPGYAMCHLTAGKVYASIGKRDNKVEATEKAKKHYQRFVDLSPPDDPRAAKVRQLLEEAQ